jgi:energy-coupling factor transporter transmembrane protein EcfT
MQLDATVVYYAYFNFYLGQLYSNIVEEAATSATAMIAKRLKTQAYKRYYTNPLGIALRRSLVWACCFWLCHLFWLGS